MENIKVGMAYLFSALFLALAVALSIMSIAQLANISFTLEELTYGLVNSLNTAIIALSLEGLIMVVKYSQLEMAGNLFYPVAIVISAAILLLSLGGFLRLTQAEVARPPLDLPGPGPASGQGGAADHPAVAGSPSPRSQ